MPRRRRRAAVAPLTPAVARGPLTAVPPAVAKGLPLAVARGLPLAVARGGRIQTL